MPAHDRFALANGLRLHYRESGQPTSPPVILLHGGCAHTRWWDGTSAAIADAHRVLALDLRGHGDSQWSEPPAYRISDHVADLAALVEHLALPRIHLVGHSLGGMVAAAYAARAPQRLASLALVDSQARISVSGARYMMRLRYFPHPIFRDYDEAVRRFRLLPTQTNASPEALAHVAAHGVRQLPDGRWTLKFDRESLAHPQPEDFTAPLRHLSCPVLFIRGAHSTIVSHAGLAALQAAVPQAQTVEIPDAHHHVMLDNPPAFERVIRRFLESAN